jgi:hypothetical protein
MVLPILGAIGGALISARASSNAARAQTNSANRQIAYSEETRDQIRSDLAPFRQAGETAQNALMFEYGMGDRPAGYRGFEQTPGYDFQLEQGQRAIDGSAAASGNLFSGATQKAQMQFGQGVAQQGYGNYLNGLNGLAGSGQNAAMGGASAMTNNAQMVNNSLSGIGNAQAAGAVGTANAINNGIGNALGAYQYQQASGQKNNALWG